MIFILVSLVKIKKLTFFQSIYSRVTYLYYKFIFASLKTLNGRFNVSFCRFKALQLSITRVLKSETCLECESTLNVLYLLSGKFCKNSKSNIPHNRGSIKKMSRINIHILFTYIIHEHFGVDCKRNQYRILHFFFFQI